MDQRKQYKQLKKSVYQMVINATEIVKENVG